MRVGYFGARSDSRGLAQQARGFCKWLEPDCIWGIDMYAENLSPYPNDWSSFESDLTVTTRSALNEHDVKKWLKGLDVIIGAETFYCDLLPVWAREMNVRTVLQINPEFQVWHLPDNSRQPHPPRPDLLIAPTTWMLDKMLGVTHLPFPVDREEFPFRLRTKADHFVHVAGHRATRDRAGSRLVMAALRHLQPGPRVTLRSQSELGIETRAIRYPNVEVEIANLSDPRMLYEDADVVVIPRRYGGQHLSMNEALSSGCPVITLNRPPENEWGGVSTIPSRARKFFGTHFGQIEWWDGSPSSLAQKMTELHHTPSEVERLSKAAGEYAESISWSTLLPRYHDLFSQMMASV